MFILLDKIPERDGRTDGQKWCSYYNGLHCEQCGRAIKIAYKLKATGHIKTPFHMVMYLSRLYKSNKSGRI